MHQLHRRLSGREIPETKNQKAEESIALGVDDGWCARYVLDRNVLKYLIVAQL